MAKLTRIKIISIFLYKFSKKLHLNLTLRAVAEKRHKWLFEFCAMIRLLNDIFSKKSAKKARRLWKLLSENTVNFMKIPSTKIWTILFQITGLWANLQKSCNLHRKKLGIAAQNQEMRSTAMKILTNNNPSVRLI